MKKIILSFFFALLSASFFVVTPVLAIVDQNERWVDGKFEYKVARTGNNIELTSTVPKIPRAAGIPNLVGKITGTTFSGKVYLVADDCPNLDGYVPASGTVSGDGSSITVIYNTTDYYYTNCVEKANSESEVTITYTKTSAQNSPSPQPSSPTPSKIPLNLNGIWTSVNEIGTSFTFSGRHAGNSLTMQITDASDAEIKDSIGKTSLSGTLSGHAFSGTQILIPYAPKCLGKYFNTDGTGTVATDGSYITISYTNFKYDGDTCAKIPGTEFSGSVTYVRANAEQKSTQSKDIKQVSPSPEITGTVEKPLEKPLVGVSSKDFRELVRVNAEFQQAQADLEKIKANKDQHWEDKKDFARQYKTQLEATSIQITEKFQADRKNVEETLTILRTDLEQIRDLATVYGDIKDFREYLNGGKFDSYGGIAIVADVGNGITTYIDLIADGVSVEDATTKTTIDTLAPSMFYLFPPLKGADLAAKLPDDILGALGVPEDHWSREATGFLAKNSPSGFVELTTDTMIKTQNWTNMGGALQMAWEDMKTAEGFGEKLNATIDLIGTAVGAVPVAVALGVRDAVFSGSQAAVDYISSWFTYPN